MAEDPREHQRKQMMSYEIDPAGKSFSNKRLIRRSKEKIAKMSPEDIETLYQIFSKANDNGKYQFFKNLAREESNEERRAAPAAGAGAGGPAAGAGGPPINQLVVNRLQKFSNETGANIQKLTQLYINKGNYESDDDFFKRLENEVPPSNYRKTGVRFNISTGNYRNNKSTKVSTTVKGQPRYTNPHVEKYRRAILNSIKKSTENIKTNIEYKSNSNEFNSNSNSNSNDNNSPNHFGGATKTFGSRAQVWHGSAIKTTGGLLKSDLMMNKRGRIISKKRHKLGKKAHKKLVAAGYKTKKGVFGVFKNGKNLSS